MLAASATQKTFSDCHHKYIFIGEVVKNKDQESLYSILVGDVSGSIILSIWGDVYQAIRPGDMLKIIDG